MEVSNNMKLTIRSIALAGLMAMCLIVAPALSAPANDGAFKTQCNVSEKSNCMASQPGMGPMSGQSMGHKGGQGMGPRGNEMTGMHENGPMCMMNGMDRPCKDGSYNETKEIEIRKVGNGFALTDNQYHLLKIKIDGEIVPDMGSFKTMISDNKTLGQIKSEMKDKIKAEIASASYNGNLTLGKSHYKLLNIKLTPLENNSTSIDANIAGPKVNFNDDPKTVVGHITATISRYENSTIAEGTLTMNSGEYSGQYKVLLDMGHGMGKGMHGCMKEGSFDGMKKHMDEKSGFNKETTKQEDKGTKKPQR
jgi:hypothetical protein